MMSSQIVCSKAVFVQSRCTSDAYRIRKINIRDGKNSKHSPNKNNFQCVSVFYRQKTTNRSLYIKQVPTAHSTSEPDTAQETELVTASLSPFHLAIPVKDLASSREFYGRILGFPEGRSAARWVDYNFFGHQVVCHVVDGYDAQSTANAVDGDPVPVPHFGLAMTCEAFHSFAARLRQGGVEFVIEPHLRFEGQAGEQWTMFFKDPSGNSLEFKAMTNPDNLFAKYVVDG